MKTYFKSLARSFKHHITRLLSIIFIVLVSVGFCAGIGLASDKIGYSLTDYYKSADVSDFILKSSAGFDADAGEKLEAVFPDAHIESATVIDADVVIDGKARLTRLYFLDFSSWRVNSPRVISGEIKRGDSYSVLSENPDNKISGAPAGSKITLDFGAVLNSAAAYSRGSASANDAHTVPEGVCTAEFTVSAVVQSPLTFSVNGEASNYSYLDENGNPLNAPVADTTDGMNKVKNLLEDILYIDSSALDVLPPLLRPYFGVTDYFVSAHGEYAPFTSAYDSFAEGKAAQISSLFEGVTVLTLQQNYSFKSLNAYVDRLLMIGIVLMVAFLLVTMLVVLSTMTRLVEEERGQIACLSTMGYSPAKIISKYILFALIATVIGGIAAYFIGLGVADLIYWVFNYSFTMPPASSSIAITFFAITFSVIIVGTLAATVIAGVRTLGENCAELLRPRAPRAGGKVLIEKIPFIWNRLSFKYKSTVRNVLRYKSRFIMTVIAVAVSMALVMAGLTLLDICLFRGVESVSITIISLVIVFFAGLLTAVVVYTLTSINISERTRELATLKVLGYYDGEVAWYIYREIFIDTAVGIVLGFPLSALIMAFLFHIMAAGTFATFMWAVAPVVIMLFTGAVTLILRRKITKIDMNGSLKAIE